MAGNLPEVSGGAVFLDAKEELLNECESIWKQMEKCQRNLKAVGRGAVQKSDTQISMLMMQMKALAAEYNEWQKRSPEIISTNPDVLLALGKEELQKVKNSLEMVLSTVQSRHKEVEENLKRECQWYEEQEQVVNTLNQLEEETKAQLEQRSKKSLNTGPFSELQNKILKISKFKEELLSALGEFLNEHFPLPKKERSTKKKKSSVEPAVELISLHEILELLINKLVNTPHDPYITVSDSFWPPYIELLLRYGIALRHPEDPNRMRLEAFHM